MVFSTIAVLLLIYLSKFRVTTYMDWKTWKSQGITKWSGENVKKLGENHNQFFQACEGKHIE